MRDDCLNNPYSFTNQISTTTISRGGRGRDMEFQLFEICTTLLSYCNGCFGTRKGGGSNREAIWVFDERDGDLTRSLREQKWDASFTKIKMKISLLSSYF